MNFDAAIYDGLPGTLREDGEALLRRFDLGDSAGSWSERFSPLTLRYVELQAQGFGLDAHRVQTASMGHLRLLVHAFLEDRFLDGQMRLTRGEALFVKHLWLTGISLLETVAETGSGHGLQHFRSLQLDEHNRYMWAQTTQYCSEQYPEFQHSRVLQIASGRAALGFMAVGAVLTDAFPSVGRKTRNAFDFLVTGLQWVDDLQDWRADLRTGDENLLLVILKGLGLDPYAHPNDAVREPNVGYALVSNGIIDFAAHSARKNFLAAKRRQAELNCTELVQLIQQRIDSLGKLRFQVLDEIETDVISRLAVSL